MANPNNCSTCDHSQDRDDGHCYMFRNEPEGVCMQHTGRKRTVLGFAELVSDPINHEATRPASSGPEHH